MGDGRSTQRSPDEALSHTGPRPGSRRCGSGVGARRRSPSRPPA
jgi:hypothetical protein